MSVASKGRATECRLVLSEGATAPLSAANEVAFRYNTALNRAELSTNGGPYVPFASGAGQLIFANIAAMAAYGDALLDNGSECIVATLLANWELVRASTVVPDGITVVATNSGVGNWHRRACVLSYWIDQTTWYADAITGDDENDGLTVGTPLRTLAEFSRRLDRGMLDHLVTLQLLSDFPGENFEPLCVTSGPSEYGIGQLHVQGERTLQHSGTVGAGSLPWNPALGQKGTIVDLSLPLGGWAVAGLVGLFFEMTSGLNTGCVGCVARSDPTDLTGKTAFYSPLLNPITYVGSLNPAVGDTFDVYEVTTIGGYCATRAGNCYLTTADLRFTYFSVMQPVFGNWSGTVFWATLCQFVGTFAEIFSSTLELSGCRVNMQDLFLGHGATAFMDGNFYDECGVTMANGCILVNYEASVTFGDSPYVEPGFSINSPSHALLFDWWGFFDIVLGQPVIRVTGGGNVTDYAGVWGDNCTSAVAMDFGYAGGWFYSGPTPAILGAAQDTLIGSTYKAYGALPYADLVLNSRVVIP